MLEETSVWAIKTRAFRLPDLPARWREPERHRVRPGEAFRIEADAGDVLAVFLQVLGDFVGGRRGLDHLGHAFRPRHIAAICVGAEVETDARIPLDVTQLLTIRLRVREHHLSVPQEPHRHRLPLSVPAHSHEPSDLFLAQPPPDAEPPALDRRRFPR